MSSSLHTTIALVAAVAVVVAVHSTVAAPQSDGDVTITIAGQQCKCVPFYLCESTNSIDVPSGSTEPGCANELVCCRVQGDVTLSPVTESYPPSSESHTPSSESHTPSSESHTPSSESCTPLSESCKTSSESTQEPHNTENNKPCTCVSRNQCLPSNGSNERQSSNIRAGNHCSSNKVCCINEYVNIGTTQETPIIGDPINKNVRSCGIGKSPPNAIGYRIINPEDNSNTYFGQYPWMAAILNTDINEETGKKTENVFLCGGSIIHPRVILTAAHCVRGKDIRLMKVRVGVWDTQSSSSEEDREKLHDDRGVSNIVYHPNHNNGTMYNDVALVELESEVILNPHVNVICIPNNEKQINYDSQSCVSTGWGKNGFEPGSRYQNVLKRADLSLVPNDLCQQQLRSTRLGNFFRLHESFLCAGGIKGVDVCKGDGGGPLICAMKGYQGEPKKYIQVGIVSWGIGCGDENVPGVYSSVVFNSQWINKELKTITSQ